jgi:hypothetical protein
VSANRVVIGAFVGSIALITYRDFKQNDPSWPLGPVPPPYRYTWCAVVFGLCALISDLLNEKIGSVIAGGVFMGLAFNVVTKAPSTSGLASSASPNLPTSSATSPISSASSVTGVPAPGQHPTNGA